MNLFEVSSFESTLREMSGNFHNFKQETGYNLKIYILWIFLIYFIVLFTRTIFDNFDYFWSGLITINLKFSLFFKIFIRNSENYC